MAASRMTEIYVESEDPEPLQRFIAGRRDAEFVSPDGKIRQTDGAWVVTVLGGDGENLRNALREAGFVVRGWQEGPSETEDDWETLQS